MASDAPLCRLTDQRIGAIEGEEPAEKPGCGRVREVMVPAVGWLSQHVSNKRVEWVDA